MQCWLTCPMGVKSDLPVKSDPAVKSRDCNIFHIKKICNVSSLLSDINRTRQQRQCTITSRQDR